MPTNTANDAYDWNGVRFGIGDRVLTWVGAGKIEEIHPYNFGQNASIIVRLDSGYNTVIYTNHLRRTD